MAGNAYRLSGLFMGFVNKPANAYLKAKKIRKNTYTRGCLQGY